MGGTEVKREGEGMEGKGKGREGKGRVGKVPLGENSGYATASELTEISVLQYITYVVQSLRQTGNHHLKALLSQRCLQAFITIMHRHPPSMTSPHSQS